MNEEEKKAIERVKDTFYEMPLEDFKSITLYRDSIKDVFILLTSFEKLQEENKVFKRALDNETADRSNDLLELQKKDKIIDLMAEFIENNTLNDVLIENVCLTLKCKNEECHEDNWKECIKQYFERRVEDETI